MLQLGLGGPVPLALLLVFLTAEDLELASEGGSFCALVNVMPRVYESNGAEGREHLLTDRVVSKTRGWTQLFLLSSFFLLLFLLLGTGRTGSTALGVSH